MKKNLCVLFLVLLSLFVLCVPEVFAESDGENHSNMMQRPDIDPEKDSLEKSDAAGKGDPNSLYYSGKVFYMVDGQYKIAFQLFLSAAKAGHKEAQYMVGYMYYKGEGVEQNSKEAIKWFTAAANSGDEHAMTIVEKYVELEEDKEFEELDKFVKSPLEEEKKQKLEEIKKNAEKGDVSSKQFLEKLQNTDEEKGNVKDVGKKTPKAMADLESSLKKNQKTAKKESKNTKIFIFIGLAVFIVLIAWSRNSKKAERLCRIGADYEKVNNFDEAMKCYGKAAELGSLEAQNHLGNIYYNANSFEEAFKWYEKAAEQGFAEAQKMLGDMYFNGNGVGQNSEEALKWYEKAAEQNEAEAQIILGTVYYEGEVTEKNVEKAIFWLTKAANQGLVEAQCLLGDIYYFRREGENDLKEAFNLYFSAADKGDPYSQYSLGVMYYNGECADRDYDRAFSWFYKAAKQEFVDAQFELGTMFENGEGVPQSYSGALKWYKKAADAGYERALEKLKELDCVGEGRKITVTSKDREKELFVETTNIFERLLEEAECEPERLVHVLDEFVVAAISGDDKARQILDELKEAIKASNEQALLIIGTVMEMAANGDMRAFRILVALRTGFDADEEYESEDEDASDEEYESEDEDASDEEVEPEGEDASDEEYESEDEDASDEEYDSEDETEWEYIQKERRPKRADEILAEIMNTEGRHGSLSHISEQVSKEIEAKKRKSSNIKFAMFLITMTVLIVAAIFSSQYDKKPDDNDPLVQLDLGVKYADEHNYGEAFKWFMKSAEQGNAYAQMFVGLMYYDGTGKDQDYLEAYKWFLKAAKQGLPEAQRDLAIMYYRGVGISQNYDEAYNWFLKAAKQKDSEAMFYIGEMYSEGKVGEEENYEEAYKWHLKSAELGNAKAQFFIGFMYYAGGDVEQNSEEAFKWFIKAAKQDYALAQLFVGALYLLGDGVEEDKEKGTAWCKKAAKQGLVKADDLLEEYEKNGKKVIEDILGRIKPDPGWI